MRIAIRGRKTSRIQGHCMVESGVNTSQPCAGLCGSPTGPSSLPSTTHAAHIRGNAASLSLGGPGPVPVYHNGKERINVLQKALTRWYSADELRPFRQSTAGGGDRQDDH